MSVNTEAVKSFPPVMTEAELIAYLRIPEVSKAKDHAHVVANLKAAHRLPCLYISNRCLYPRDAVDAWILEHTTKGGKS